MVQVKKDAVEQRICASAQACFAELGFSRTTIKRIADDAGIGVGNIYRYFPNKNVLFQALVDRAAKRCLAWIRRYGIALKKRNRIPENIGGVEEEIFQSLEGVIDFLYAERDPLYLLWHSADGSPYASFKEILIERYHEIGMLQYGIMIERYPDYRMSAFMLRQLAHWYVEIVGQFLKQRMDKEQMARYTHELSYLLAHGTLTVMQRGNPYAEGTPES